MFCYVKVDFLVLFSSNFRNITKAEEKCKSLEEEITGNDEILKKIDVFFHY